MKQQDYAIISSQTTIHQDLFTTVAKHRQTLYERPIAQWQVDSWQQAMTWCGDRELIIDGGCGTGLSTQHLATRYPQAFVLGVDKSLARLQRGQATSMAVVKGNWALLRADLIDFLRLMAKHNKPIKKLYLLYPNPWPKPQQLKKRWYAHPVLPSIFQCCQEIEVRSNWSLYIEEFAAVAEFCGHKASAGEFCPAVPISLFEKKYLLNQVPLHRLLISSLSCLL